MPTRRRVWALHSHFSPSPKEAAHAIDCLSNKAAQAAKNYKKSGGNVQLLTAGPMSLNLTTVDMIIIVTTFSANFLILFSGFFTPTSRTTPALFESHNTGFLHWQTHRPARTHQAQATTART